METQSNEKLHSRRQLAERWAVHPKTLIRYEKAGMLRFLKLKNRIRYRLSDIEAFEAAASSR